ncbi:MAG: acetolactate decarboxylase [Candidatus Tantalella remota]|nr:acetolactate decarboxylase [Candidatus Tantalella remota]
MKLIRYYIILVLLAIPLTADSQEPGREDTLFQVSTIDALLEGVYDGDVTFKELKTRGDLGIGTFDRLDGEMIFLDGKFYKVRVDGKVYDVGDEETTPFAAVTFFSPDTVAEVSSLANIEQLKEWLDTLIPSENMFYAVKIEGTFGYIKTRSVPAQEKPYPLLVEVAKGQSIFEFENVKGTLLGFRCPPYVKGVNVPGYHLHFITEDRSAGGHLLECRIDTATAELDLISGFYMVLPDNEDFMKADLSGDKEIQLKGVEQK